MGTVNAPPPQPSHVRRYLLWPLRWGGRVAVLAFGLVWPGLLLAAGAVPGPPTKNQGKVIPMNSMPQLSADLVPLIADPSIHMLHVRLNELGPGQAEQDGLQVRTGPALVEVLEVIQSTVAQRGQLLTLPVVQLLDPAVRSKNAINQWNNLPLDPGVALVLACSGTLAGGRCVAQGGQRAEAGAGGNLEALRQCYAIEAHRNLPQAERWNRASPLLVAALQGRQTLLFQYALDFAGRRAVLGRDAGASLLAQAMTQASIPTDQRFEIATHLVTRTRFFDPERRLDRANTEVVSALATGMVSEADGRRKLAWSRLLSSKLLSELAPREADALLLRRSLARSVPGPLAESVRHTLSTLLAGADESDRARLSALLAAWQ